MRFLPCCSEFKVIRTSGAPASPGSPPVATTAVACASTKSFFAGHADGVVRAYGLVSGAVERTFRPPAAYAPDPAVAGGASVTAIALYGSVGGAREQQVLAVGHADGTIHNFSAASGAFLTTFSCRPGLTQLLSLRRFSSLAAVHAGDNSLTLWDLGSDRSVVLDFSAELTSIHRRSSAMTCCRYDDARGVILCGADDGSVFVRSVTRIEGTGDLAVRLSRFCAPSAEAQAPSRVSGGPGVGVGGGFLTALVSQLTNTCSCPSPQCADHVHVVRHARRRALHG